MFKYTHCRVCTTWLYLYFSQYVSYVYLTRVWSYCLSEFILSECFLNDFVPALYFVLWSRSYLYSQNTFTTIMPMILTCSGVLPYSHECSKSVLSLLLFCSWPFNMSNLLNIYDLGLSSIMSACSVSRVSNYYNTAPYSCVSLVCWHSYLAESFLAHWEIFLVLNLNSVNLDQERSSEWINNMGVRIIE